MEVGSEGSTTTGGATDELCLQPVGAKTPTGLLEHHSFVPLVRCNSDSRERAAIIFTTNASLAVGLGSA